MPGRIALCAGRRRKTADKRLADSAGAPLQPVLGDGMAQPQQRPAQGVVRFYNFLPEGRSFLDEVLIGLGRPHKALAPKYFYDARGCDLFEQICESPEYYPTRTELAIMGEHAAAMARFLGPECQLIEFGSGSSRKTRLLLEQL